MQTPKLFLSVAVALFLTTSISFAQTRNSSFDADIAGVFEGRQDSTCTFSCRFAEFLAPIKDYSQVTIIYPYLSFNGSMGISSTLYFRHPSLPLVPSLASQQACRNSADTICQVLNHPEARRYMTRRPCNILIINDGDAILRPFTQRCN